VTLITRAVRSLSWQSDASNLLKPVDSGATANKFKGLRDLGSPNLVASFIGALRADSDGPAITQGTAPANAFE